MNLSVVKTDNPVVDQGTIRENKLALVERLADDLAHEIKNPLHSMVINLEVLRRRLVRLESEAGTDLLRYAGVLASELERVNRRVDLLLRMVRPQRETDDATTLTEVLEELRELVELECERHDVALRMETPNLIIPAALPRASTRQMILSLILKTLDSSPPGGALHVHVDMQSGSTLLHVFSLDEAGNTPAFDSADDDRTYLSVARTLAERLGGTLDIQTSPRADAIRKDVAGTGYVLSLPR